MHVTITSTFPVRDKSITTYSSFPVYSPEIEKTMVRSIDFLSKFDSYSLEMKIIKKSS